MRALWFWVGALALALAIFRLFWPAFTACFQTRDNWAISVYRGRRPFQLEPHPDVGNRPVVTASDVTDAQAEFVADPFMIRRDGRWLMMFEVMERGRWAGSFAYAESDNGTTWKYGRVVLREPFHLSYPQIIEDDDGELYLIPESAQAGSLRLYHAAHFPESWVFVAELLPGQHRDATVFRDGGSWWMYSTDSSHSLHLFVAPTLRGPWREHPASPVVKECRRSGRCGGKVVRVDGVLHRFAQDGRFGYGREISAYRIDRLTAADYAETEVALDPPLGASDTGWNSCGMHHVDAHLLEDGSWLAVVDGNRQAKVFNWRAGARECQRKLTAMLRSPGGAAASRAPLS